MSAFEPSRVRRALDELLSRHPHLDVVSIDWQVEPADGRSVARWRGPWVQVELGQPSEQIEIEPAWAIWRFAIWKRTGDVYTVNADGAVIEPPVVYGEPQP